jgi:hypothetical protein
MAQQDIASLGLDVTRLQKDTAEALKYYQDVIDAIKKLESLKVSPGNYVDLINKQKEAIGITNQLGAAVDNLGKAQEKVVTSTKEETDAIIRQNKEKQAALKTQQEEIRLAKLQADADTANSKAQQEAINIRIAKIKEENEIIKQIGNEQSVEAKQRKAESEQRIAQINEEIAAIRKQQVEGKGTPVVSTPSASVTPTVSTTTPIDTTPQVNAITTAYEKYTFSLRENLAQQLENEAAIAGYKVQLKELNDAISANGGTATEAQKAKIVELREQILLLSQSNRELIATQNNLAKEMLSDEGSVNQMRAQLNSLVATYDKLNATERATPFGQQLKKEIDTIEPKVKELEASVGRFQRNVGNYPKNSYAGLQAELAELTKKFNLLTAAEQRGNAGAVLTAEMEAVKKKLADFGTGTNVIVNAASKGFGVIRQLAYILPGIGIAGIFGVITDGLAAIVTKLFETTEAFNAVKEAHRDYINVVQEGQKNSEKEIINLQILEKVATDVTKPMGVRLNAVKDLQTEYPSYLGNLSQEAILSGQAAEEIDKLSTALFQKAYAEAAANKAAELGIKNLDLQGKASFLYQEQQKELANIAKEQKENNSAVLANGAYIQNGNDGLVMAQQHLAQINDLLEKNRKEQIFNNVEIQRYIDEGAKFAGVVQDLTKGGNYAGATEKFKSYLAALIKAQEDGNKMLLEDEIKFRQSVADSDAFAYEERIRQAKKASELRKQLINDNKSDELAQNRAQEAEALSSYSDAVTKANANAKLSAADRNKILADAAIERNIAEAAFEQQRANIVLKADIAIKNEEVSTLAELGKLKKDEHAKQLAEDAEAQRKFQELADKERETPASKEKALQGLAEFNISLIQGAADSAARATALAYTKEQTELTKRYNEGKISKEKFEKAKRDLEIKYSKESLTAAIAAAEAELKLLRPGSKAFDELKQKIADAQLALQNLNTKTAENKIKDLANTLDTVAEVTRNLTAAMSDINNIGYDNQKAALEELEAQQEKNYEKEVTNINNSTLSEQQKADTLKILEAERQAQKDANDRKQRAADNAKAKFDKEMAIMNIIVQTAVAVVKALATAGPFAIPLAISIGALGAAELVAAVATKIPQYATGTDDHKGGLAVVGEGKNKELVQMPGGESFIADKPMMLDLPAHTKVIPLQPTDINAMMNRSMMAQTAALMPKEKKEDSAMLLMAQNASLNKQLINALKKNRPIINIHDNSAYLAWKKSRTNW